MVSNIEKTINEALDKSKIGMITKTNNSYSRIIGVDYQTKTYSFISAIIMSIAVVNSELKLDLVYSSDDEAEGVYHVIRVILSDAFI